MEACGLGRESLTKSEKVLFRLHSDKRDFIVGDHRGGQGEKNEGEKSAVHRLEQVPHRVPESGGVDDSLERAISTLLVYLLRREGNQLIIRAHVTEAPKLMQVAAIAASHMAAWMERS